MNNGKMLRMQEFLDLLREKTQEEGQKGQCKFVNGVLCRNAVVWGLPGVDVLMDPGSLELEIVRTENHNPVICAKATEVYRYHGEFCYVRGTLEEALGVTLDYGRGGL